MLNYQRVIYGNMHQLNGNWSYTSRTHLTKQTDSEVLKTHILWTAAPLNAASLYRRSTSGTRVIRMSMSVSLDCAMETNISDSSTPSYLANKSFSLWLNMAKLSHEANIKQKTPSHRMPHESASNFRKLSTHSSIWFSWCGKFVVWSQGMTAVGSHASQLDRHGKTLCWFPALGRSWSEADDVWMPRYKATGSCLSFP